MKAESKENNPNFWLSFFTVKQVNKTIEVFCRKRERQHLAGNERAERSKIPDYSAFYVVRAALPARCWRSYSQRYFYWVLKFISTIYSVEKFLY